MEDDNQVPPNKTQLPCLEIPQIEKRTIEPDIKEMIQDIIENVIEICQEETEILKLYQPKPKIFECRKCKKMFAQHKSAQKHQKDCKGVVKPNPIVCQM